MTEKYSELRDSFSNTQKEIHDMRKVIEEKLDAGSVAGLKYYFDEYNAKLDSLVDLKYNYQNNMLRHMSECLFVIAKNINRIDGYEFVSKDMNLYARALNSGFREEFTKSDFSQGFQYAVSKAIMANVVDAECIGAIEDVYDYVGGNLTDFTPEIFPLLSDDGKANYFNSFVKSYCSANLSYDFSKGNFTEENYSIKTIFKMAEADASLGYLNKNNVENVDMIKSVLEKMNDMKDFDILDDSIEQENATRIKNILQQVVSVAEPPTKSYNQELETGKEDPDEFWYTGR